MAEQLNPSGTRGFSTVDDIVGLAARLIPTARTPEAFTVLGEEIGRFVSFQNFIVYVFVDGASPVLFQTNLGLPWLQNQMADYINGLYVLDPFHRLTVERRAGLFRMRDIMPEAFPESEYYRHFYEQTTVTDEVRYVVPAGLGTAVHVFIEREGAEDPFSYRELALLECLEPLVRAFVLTHEDWRNTNAAEERPFEKFELRSQIQGLGAGILTLREVDTVELMLKGHSTKSMARVLGIDDGTAANHKRNIYAKLDVHSAAQLFDLFLRSLTE